MHLSILLLQLLLLLLASAGACVVMLVHAYNYMKQMSYSTANTSFVDNLRISLSCCVNFLRATLKDL